jgi:Fur family transcriptional regulator, ferric uptake regulator
MFEGDPMLPRQADQNIVKKNERNKEDDLKKMIRAMGLKITDQRLLIINCLHDASFKSGERHVTAQELYEKAVKKDAKIGFATVYRFLRDLATHQFVTEVRLGGQPSRYELTNQEHHDHLTCTGCGKICEFENDKIEKLQASVAEYFGFKLTHHVLELYGLCPSCQSK